MKATLQESIENMEKIAKRSNMLWLSVNNAIVAVLKSDMPTDDKVRRLKELAGPRKKQEPVCLENFRTAARQLKRGELVSVL